MQCTSYFPECNPRQDLNGKPSPSYTNEISPNMSGQSYNSNFYPSHSVDQIRVVYQNEVVRRTMLRHDNIFRGQVQELHRLHRRQRELMDEFRPGIKYTKVVPMSHYNPICSKVSPDCASMAWQTPTGPTLPWLIPSVDKLSTPVSKSPFSIFSFLDTSPENEINSEKNELLTPKCKKPERKILDLELPAEDYIDSGELNGYEVQTDSVLCENDKDTKIMAFDLNMPPTLSLDLEIFQTNMGIENGEKLDHDNLEKEREEFVISQVSPPPIQSKKSIKYSNEELLETKGKINLIDLNSFAKEVEPSTKLITSNTMPGTVLEPVSPENKESSPPRGESEENIVEPPSDDLVNTAAETIFWISKSSFNEKNTITSLVKSLGWFAGIVVSSMGKNLEAYEAGILSEGSEKQENKCIVALPSQQGKRHRKRRNRKIKEKEEFGSFSSLMSYSLASGEKGLRSWGKVKKRPIGTRVPASSVRLLWG